MAECESFAVTNKSSEASKPPIPTIPAILTTQSEEKTVVFARVSIGACKLLSSLTFESYLRTTDATVVRQQRLCCTKTLL